MRRIDQLTFTRFLAAIAIVVFHYGRSIVPFSHDSISTLFKHANLGVSYFFILSGFVMVIAYSRRDSSKINPSRYYLNRVARIYPMYLIALFLTFFIYYKKDLEITTLSSAVNILGLQAWFPSYALDYNFTGWSISVEILFYALFPILFNKVYLNCPLRKIYVYIVLFWLANQLGLNLSLDPGSYQKLSPDTLNLLYYSPILHLNEFLAGNIAGFLFLRFHQKQFRNYDIPLLIVVAALMLLIKAGLPLYYHNGLLAILFVPLIVLLSANTGMITKLFAHRYLVFLGEISYGIYILQYPIHQYSVSLLRHIGIRNQSVVFYLYVVILIIIASVSYKFIEVPLREKIKTLGIRSHVFLKIARVFK